uniref:Mas-related G-protein coupled receptor member H n=1 Tax=Cyanoderma ruficeps TaxID=181631 RepID=A0A8C3QMF6_9PASS
MGVTTVSPSPASPTEGDELCETDVTNVAIHSVTLLISLYGLVGNGAVLHLLSLKDRNAYIFDLAFADFIFLLFTVSSTLFFLVEDVSCSHIMPQLYLTLLLQLSVFSCYWALFRLTHTRSLENIYRLCLRCNISEHLAWLAYRVQFWALFALFIVIPAVTDLCPSHQQEHCQAAVISTNIVILFLFPAPMVISNTIDLIQAKRGSKKQKPRRHNIVMFLIVLFILILSLFNFLQQLGYIVVSSKVVFLLTCIQSSIKPFIYFLAGGFQRPCSLRSLQSSLQRVFDEQEVEAAHSYDAPMDTGL